MPTIAYDKLERAWRLDDDAGNPKGYYQTEALALAALGPAEGCEAAPVAERGTCVVRNGDKYEIYVDGALVSTAPSWQKAEAAFNAAVPLTLADGTPVQRRIDTDGSHLGVAVHDWQGACIAVSEDGDISVGQVFKPHPFESSFDIDVSLKDWSRVRAFMASGATEQLIALAAGKPAPALDPLSAGYKAGSDTSEAPHIAIEPYYDDDGDTEPSQLIYHCGAASLWVGTDDPTDAPALLYKLPNADASKGKAAPYGGFDGVPLSALRDARTLLKSPQVAALLGEASATPAVRCERFVSQPDCVDGSVFTGWSFLAGEGEHKAEYYFPDAHDAHNHPQLYTMRLLELDAEVLRGAYPNVRALLDSPDVQRALTRWHAGLPAVEAPSAPHEAAQRV